MLTFFNCVGPPDPVHGLVENLPVIVNTENIFSYSVNGDKYSSEDFYDLKLSISDSIHKIITSLVITDYSGFSGDTTCTIIVENDSNIVSQIIDGEFVKNPFFILGNSNEPSLETIVDSVFFFPKKVKFIPNRFSGKLDFMMVKSFR